MYQTLVYSQPPLFEAASQEAVKIRIDS